MKFKCGSVGQYKSYDMTISGFIKGPEYSCFGVFMCSCDCLWPWSVCGNVCIRIYAVKCVPAGECEALVQLSVFRGKYCLPDCFCMLAPVFSWRYGFMYFDIKKCGFKRGNDALCRVTAELFMHTLCNKRFAWAWQLPIEVHTILSWTRSLIIWFSLEHLENERHGSAYWYLEFFLWSWKSVING